VITNVIDLLKNRVFRSRGQYVFYGMLAFFVAYGVIFIMKASFLYQGTRYFSLFDDAMISMQYAKNLANGSGLIWDLPGIRVEGYTNFLWTIYMAFWHMLPISAAKMALPIQISGLSFLVGSLFLVRKIADFISGGNAYVSLGAVLLTASYLPINFWALRGMETSVLGFILLLAAWRFLKGLESGRFDPSIFVILGVGMLTRADFVYLFVAIIAFAVAVDPKNRKKNFLAAAFVFLLVVGGHTLFRWAYYGEMLPNTCYLKMAGVSTFLRVQRGLWVAAEFIKVLSPLWFLLPFVCGVLYRKNTKVLFLLYVFGAQLAYSIYVGGDAWEWWGHLANRYLCLVMPMFFILSLLAIHYFAEKMNEFLNKNALGHLRPREICFAIVLPLMIFQMHGGWSDLSTIPQLLGFTGIHVEDDKNMVRAGLKLKDITTPNATIALVWAGNLPYFADRHYIDLLGKTDAHIAHLPARVSTYKDFLPGHNKYDYAYSIGKLQPDIVAQLWRDSQEAIPWLYKNYSRVKVNELFMMFRRDSRNIYWGKEGRDFSS